MSEATIVLETSNEDFDIIEKSGILECEGVSKTAQEQPSIMGVSEVIGAMPPGIAWQIVIALATTIVAPVMAHLMDKLIKLVEDFLEKKKSFNLVANGKELVFTKGNTKEEIKNIIMEALKAQ